jgi:hypothetical protein
MAHYIKIMRQFSETSFSAFPTAGTQEESLKLGDFAIAEDTGKTYICTSLSPVTWKELGTDSAPGGQAFPIGSVFIAVVATNPSTLLGYGTWTAIAAGRMLVGLDSSDAAMDAAEKVGGAKTVTLDTTMIPAHTHMQRRHGTTTGTLSGITTAPDTLLQPLLTWDQ